MVYYLDLQNRRGKQQSEIQLGKIELPHHKRHAAIFTIIVFFIAFLVIAVVLTSFHSPAQNISQTVRVQVSYGGAWQGAYGDVSGIVSWSGNGPYSVTLTRGNQGLWVVSVNAQKMDDSSTGLTVSIIGSDGHVIKSATTSAAYGMAQVAANIDG
jgi:hypothetical protein